MKFKFLISIFLLSFLIGQDRSTLFSTGDDVPNPDSGGYAIQNIGNEIYGAGDRFFLSNEYMLERVYVYLTYLPEDMFDNQSVEIQLCEDDNGKPGNPIFSNTLNLDYNNYDGNWYSFSLLEECLKTEASSYYWITVLPMEGTDAQWIFSENDNFFLGGQLLISEFRFFIMKM